MLTKIFEGVTCEKKLLCRARSHQTFHATPKMRKKINKFFIYFLWGQGVGGPWAEHSVGQWSKQKFAIHSTAWGGGSTLATLGNPRRPWALSPDLGDMQHVVNIALGHTAGMGT